MIPLICPRCGQTLQVPDNRAGQKGKCPACQAIFTAPRPALASALQSSSANGGDPATLPPTARPLEGDGDAVAPELYDFLAPPQAPDELGRLGSYRVLKVLGAGGMGVIFQAEDPRLERMVALKVMLPALAASGSNKERFLREARAAAAIEHDHIIPIFQVDEDRGVPFIAMPLLRGESLEDRLKRQRVLPLDEALRIARETAEGLTAAHARNMIHRDVKPANVWLEGEKGRVKILDFGLARSASGESNLTQQGAIVGTPAYMAPEQANGRPVDFRCDLFSLGCVLYRMVAGQLPFKGADTVSTLIAVSTAKPKPPHQLNPNVPAALSRFILQMLAKAPSNRPASAQEVVAALEELATQPASRTLPNRISPPIEEEMEDGDDTLAEEALPERRQRPRSSRRRPLWPWFAAGAGVGILLLAVLVVVVLLNLPRNTSKSTGQVAQSRDTRTVTPPPPKKGDDPPPKKANDPPVNPAPQPMVAGDDRAVAEWVISIRGNVGVTPGDGSRRYSTNHIGSLPKGPFHVHQIFLSNNKRVTDDDLRRLRGLQGLEWVMLTNTGISDAGLDHLRDLPKLFQLEVQKTNVTDAGIQRFRAAFPRCNVRR